jgi:cell division protease FtsH
MARAMVTEYGMSEKLGPLRYNDNQEEIFLGHSVARTQNVSGATAKIIDEEIRRIIEEAETLARKVLNEHMDGLHKIATALLEYETLSGDEVEALLKGEEIDRSEPAGPTGDSGRRSSVRWSGAGTPAGNLRRSQATRSSWGLAIERGLF